MGTKNYITAIKIGSSEISGTVGISTYEGTKIIAYASEPVDGFISKGVVRNVDATSTCLSSIINRLEEQLGNKVTIEKAYTSIEGLSVRSIKSTVKRQFEEYTKITSDIIDSMAIENDNEFVVPEGYQKVQGIVQEYKLDGSTNTAPTGFHTRCIECSYLNIVIKEQFMKQLNESFDMAKIVIVDSFCAAKIEADILLGKENKRSCALVNMGAETTTVSIYTNNLLRKLIVIPLGGENITKDICAEHLSREEAEQLKIAKGYNAGSNEGSPISIETLNKIIGARVTEILLNVKHQIEDYEEKLAQIFFTGGAAKLKNIKELIDEHLSAYETQIIIEPSLNCFSDNNLYLAQGAITPTLFGLLSIGKENCCKEELPKEPQAPMQKDLFEEEKMEPEKEDIKIEEEKPIIEEKKEAKPTTEHKKKKNIWSKFNDLFNDFKDNVTSEEDGDDD